jgi:hypothetical protein
MGKDYIIACNADYEQRVFLVAMFYQDPDTGEVSLCEDEDIDAYSRDAFQNMTKDEFMAEFELFQAEMKPKH